MNNITQNKRLATRETVLSKSEHSIHSLANILFKYTIAVNNNKKKNTVLATNIDENTATTHFHTLLKEIYKHQVDAQQANRIYETCQTEQARYKNLTSTIEDDMMKTKKKIENLKKELVKARARREEKMQMEAKCKEINSYTSRIELETSIETMEKKRADMEQEEKDVAKEKANVLKESKAFFTTFEKLVKQLNLSEYVEKQMKLIVKDNGDDDDDDDDDDDNEKEGGRRDNKITGKKHDRDNNGGNSSSSSSSNNNKRSTTTTTTTTNNNKMIMDEEEDGEIIE